jgi:hypothetical protein
MAHRVEAAVIRNVGVASKPAAAKAASSEVSSFFIQPLGDRIPVVDDLSLLTTPIPAVALAATQVASVINAQDIAVVSPNGRSSQPDNGRRWIQRLIAAGLLLGAFGFGWFLASSFEVRFGDGDELTGRAAVDAIVERIIAVESDNVLNTKNTRSSAIGPAQFIDETWFELIRAYRPDLIGGRSKADLLKLRQDPKLAREITTRLIERNTAMLRRRGLPITAGTVYLAHFAGGAGAVAILSASESADAALVMANADTTGRTKREQLIKANPFLEHLTVADLRVWANRKMRSDSSSD